MSEKRYRYRVFKAVAKDGADWLVYQPATSPALKDDIVQIARFWSETAARDYAASLDSKEGLTEEAPMWARTTVEQSNAGL